MTRVFIASLLLAAVSGHGCAGGANWEQSAPQSSTTHAWLQWDEDGQPHYRITASIPWDDPGLHSRTHASLLVLSATIVDPNTNPIGGHAWTRQVEAGRAAGDPDEWTVELQTVPGRQELVLHLLIDGEAYGAEWRRRFEVHDVAARTLLLGEPVLLRRDDEGNWVHQGRAYTEHDAGVRLRSVLYDFAAGAPPSTYSIAYALHDHEGATVLEDTLHVARIAARTPFEIELAAPHFGLYRLEMKLAEGTRLATTACRFEVGIADLGALVGMVGNTELMALILTTAELDSLQQAPAGERARLWQEYWARRDPVPGTAVNEYEEIVVARFRDVSLHFSTSVPGWQTDRGRVYMRMGRPERIEALGRPETTERIERWTYDGGRQVFVFVDRDRSGDYVLQRTNVAGF